MTSQVLSDYQKVNGKPREERVLNLTALRLCVESVLGGKVRVAATRSEKLPSGYPGLLEACLGQLPSALKHSTGPSVSTGAGTLKV